MSGTVVDLTALKVMTNRKDFHLVRPMLTNDLSAETLILADAFGQHFETYKGQDEIDWSVLIPAVHRQNQHLSDDQRKVLNRIMNAVAKKELKDGERDSLLRDLSGIDLMSQLGLMVMDFKDGNFTGDLLTAVNDKVTRYKQRRDIKVVTYIQTPIGELLMEDEDDSGVSWRINSINKATRKLRPGDFGIIAARPDQGKTSFVSSEVTFMAPQLPEDKNVLWLNNEGPGRRIIPTWYRSALGMTVDQLVANKSTIEESYRNLMGRSDRIRVFDIHGYNTGQLEIILEENNPGIIIYDMIDHISGFEGMSRTDQKLEEMYKWGRDKSVQYDCIGLATSQISVDGAKMRFPDQHMLKDSKTGKQGACDFILMVGSLEDPMYASSRFISLPKNKLRRPTASGALQQEVHFNPLTARMEDMQPGIGEIND